MPLSRLPRLVLAVLVAATFVAVRPWDGPRHVGPALTDSGVIASNQAHPTPEMATPGRASTQTAAWTRSGMLDAGPTAVTSATLAAAFALVVVVTLFRRRDAQRRPDRGPTGGPPSRSPPLLTVV